MSVVLSVLRPRALGAILLVTIALGGGVLVAGVMGAI